MTYYSHHPDGITLSLKISTKSSRTGPLKILGDQLTWGVSAPPVDGKANKFLIESIAQHFKVSKKSIEIIRGETSRNKVILIHSCSAKISLPDFLNSIHKKVIDYIG